MLKSENKSNPIQSNPKKNRIFAEFFINPHFMRNSAFYQIKARNRKFQAAVRSASIALEAAGESALSGLEQREKKNPKVSTKKK